MSGASSSIGFHVAQRFAGAGGAASLAVRRTQRAEAAAKELASEGLRAAALYLDVTKPETIGRTFNLAQELLGAPVDVVINNAVVLHAEKFASRRESDSDQAKSSIPTCRSFLVHAQRHPDAECARRSAFRAPTAV